jgi:hypothetical protein
VRLRRVWDPIVRKTKMRRNKDDEIRRSIGKGGGHLVKVKVPYESGMS